MLGHFFFVQSGDATAFVLKAETLRLGALVGELVGAPHPAAAEIGAKINEVSYVRFGHDRAAGALCPHAYLLRMRMLYLNVYRVLVLGLVDQVANKLEL